MSKLKTDWRIVKSVSRRGQWDIETRVYLCDAGGRVETMAQNWARHSVAASKSAALHRVMLLRERGEPVSWKGGPIRLGIALIDSSPLAR